MYTKQVLFIVSLIILVAMFNTAWACHESDTGLRGHNPDLRFAGISVVTEAAFALTSTTTGCDHYTYFIQQSYHQIAENAARGEGEYLEAFAHFRGCPSESLGSFKVVIRSNYQKLFLETDPLGKSFPKRFEMVLKDHPQLRLECGTFSNSSLS
ncbi:MAG: DUF3015 family protein [Deltaproteobacteria bacterium]